MKSFLYHFIIFLGILFSISACSLRPSSEVIEIIPPEPFQYFPISFYGQNIELLAKIDTVTSITLINHGDGSVSQTFTAKSGRRNDAYRGQYEFTSLAASPQWNSTENYLKKVSSITAIKGVPFTKIETIYASEISDKKLSYNLDKLVREGNFIDSAIFSMQINNMSADDYIKFLKDKLPKLRKINFKDREIILISYELNDYSEANGAQMIKVGNTIVPLKGNCSAIPLFYAIDEHLYFRHLRSLCESGYILVDNYVVLGNSIKLEWTTSAYAN